MPQEAVKEKIKVLKGNIVVDVIVVWFLSFNGVPILLSLSIFFGHP